MKVISSLVIIDKDDVKVIYECDNKKNTKCKGYNNCRECRYTIEVKYAKDIKEEKTRIELIEELQEKDKEIEEYKSILRKIIEGQDIHAVATLNQIRKIYNLKPIESKIV